MRTLNEAFAMVSTDFVALLAADDVWLPDKLAVQVDQLSNLPEHVGVLYGDVPLMDEESAAMPSTFIESYKGRVITPEGDLFSELLQGNFLPSPSVLLRRRCWLEVGGFDESLYAEDWDFWLRVSRQFVFAVTPVPVARYRVVAQSHVRRGGAVALAGQLDTLCKWSGTAQLRSPSARIGLRRLALQVARSVELAPAKRRRAMLLWLRFGGVRLLLHGRTLARDTGGGYVLWVAPRVELAPGSRLTRLVNALAAVERVRFVVLDPAGGPPEQVTADLGVEHTLVQSERHMVRRLAREAALDGATVVVQGSALLPLLPRGHLLLLGPHEGADAPDRGRLRCSTSRRAGAVLELGTDEGSTVEDLKRMRDALAGVLRPGS